jgi:drug/metabolite transporter (DMT)-like permease
VPFPAALPAPVAGAVGLALLSTLGYAYSAVLQERAARRPDPDTPGRAPSRPRSPRWWVILGATAAGAVLHIAALARGPLSLIQPLGVLTLVLALPLGARLNRQRVTRREWVGATAVVTGLAAVLSVLPHSAPPPHLTSAGVLGTTAVAALVAAGLVALGTRLTGHRITAVVHALAASVLFGTASGMARVAVTGGPLATAAAVAVLASVIGLGLAQRAYRGGGLGAPLATINLADPVTAALVGIVVLGEPFAATASGIALGALGLLATAAGIGALTHTRPAREIVPAAPDTNEFEDAHVVR